MSKSVFRLMFVVILVVLLISRIGLAVEFDLPAKSAVLIDAKTGQVLYDKNANQKLPPASMTKIMTLLLAMEAIERGEASLDDMVTISPYAESMGGSQIYLSVKDRVPLGLLLKAVTVASANDACVATAEYIAGTEYNFVQKMNERAKQLGMNNTHFMNTTGLPHPDHYSTAYDVSLMGRQLIKYPKIREWAEIWHETVVLADGKRGMTNTNTLIKTYPPLDGIKTGHTQEAGYCLAGSAEQYGFRLVSVVMNTVSEAERNAATVSLLEYGFKAFGLKVLVEKGDTFENLAVQQGKVPAVNAVAAERLEVVVKRGETLEVTKDVTSLNKKAPIKEGEKVGELVVKQNGKELGKVDLLAAEEVEQAGLLSRIFQAIGSFFSNLWNRIF